MGYGSSGGSNSSRGCIGLTASHGRADACHLVLDEDRGRGRLRLGAPALDPRRQMLKPAQEVAGPLVDLLPVDLLLQRNRVLRERPTASPPQIHMWEKGSEKARRQTGGAGRERREGHQEAWCEAASHTPAPRPAASWLRFPLRKHNILQQWLSIQIIGGGGGGGEWKDLAASWRRSYRRGGATGAGVETGMPWKGPPVSLARCCSNATNGRQLIGGAW